MHDLWVPNSGEYSMPKMYLKGFAHTNNIINGGLECRNTSTTAFTEKVVIRSELYKYYLSILGFTPTQVAAENSGDYTTICYQNSSNAMQDYVSANVLASATFNVTALKVYPIPITDAFTIEYKEPIDRIKIFDLSGKIIQELEPKSNKVEVPSSILNNGMYIIQLETNSASATFKIIK